MIPVHLWQRLTRVGIPYSFGRFVELFPEYGFGLASQFV
jgi:hypothetical protein